MHDEAPVKRTKLLPTLPRETILQIAQFVPDRPSFFAYIEAFQGTAIGQGPMSALWNLRDTTPHLWPHLQLQSMGADAWELAIQAIPVYATVKMHALFDLHRLVDRVTPSTNLVVIHRDKPDLTRAREWFDQLALLPVRGLIYSPEGYADHMPIVMPHLCNVWPSMAYNLRALELAVGDQGALEAICKCIATSRITELSLKGEKSVDGYETDAAPHIQVDGGVWTDLAVWLRSTQVIKFDLYKLQLICDDEVSMQALNGALAASDHLHTINWWRCAIRVSAPLVLPPRLRQLSLPRCIFELVGIDCIWKVLPNLPHLTLVNVLGIPMSPLDLDTLASVLAQSNVSRLDLDSCSIGIGGHFAESIQRFADAFEATATLRVLHLADNALGFNGVKAILAAVERRPHVTETVMLVRNCCEDGHGELKALVNTRMPPNARIYV